MKYWQNLHMKRIAIFNPEKILTYVNGQSKRKLKIINSKDKSIGFKIIQLKINFKIF